MNTNKQLEDEKNYIAYNVKGLFTHYQLNEKIIKVSADCIILNKMIEDVNNMLKFAEEYPEYKEMKQEETKKGNKVIYNQRLCKRYNKAIEPAKSKERALTADKKGNILKIRKPVNVNRLSNSLSKSKSKSKLNQKVETNIKSKNTPLEKKRKMNVLKLNNTLKTKSNSNTNLKKDNPLRYNSPKTGRTVYKPTSPKINQSTKTSLKMSKIQINKKSRSPSNKSLSKDTKRNGNTPDKYIKTTNTNVLNSNKRIKDSNKKIIKINKKLLNTTKRKSPEKNITTGNNIKRRSSPKNIYTKPIKKVNENTYRQVKEKSISNIKEQSNDSDEELLNNIVEAQKNKEKNKKIVLEKINFSSTYIEALYITLKSNVFDIKTKIKLVTSIPEIYKHYSKSLLIKELICTYENIYKKKAAIYEKYNLALINILFVPSKTAQNGLNFITNEEGDLLMNKSQPKEIKLIFIIILILLNEDYRAIPNDKVIEYVFIQIFKQYNITSLKDLFLEHIVKVCNFLSIEQLNKIDELIKENPILISSVDMFSINRNISYMTFIIKEIIQFIFLKTEDQKYYYTQIRNEQLYLNNVYSKILNLRQYL